MQEIERLPQMEVRPRPSWPLILLDSVLAIGGAFCITGLIAAFRLYPAIPNISIVYLLLILPLATLRGRYAALLAALVASLSFDFFLVPPFYTFTMTRDEEWLALGIFLATALLTSQLAVMTRQNAERARMREQETRILYQMMHLVNGKASSDEQLDIIALATVRVFAPWGVRECALFLPDKQGQWQMRADAPIQIEQFQLASDEMEAANQVMRDGQIQERTTRLAATNEPALLRLVPLKSGERVVGLLCLHIQNPAPWFQNSAGLHEAHVQVDNSAAFFQTFLDQIVATIERARPYALPPL
jgi:K+-sensing histidine kinase KdpD